MTPEPAPDSGGWHARSRAAGPRSLTGGLASLPAYRSGHEAAGLLLYLPTTGTTVVPVVQPSDGSWRCVVVADPTGTHPIGSTPEVSTAEIETALPVPLGDPLADLSADTYALIWLARVWNHSHGGPTYEVARVLATQLRAPDGRTVTLDDAGVHRMIQQARVLPVGLQRLLDGLSTAGLLTRQPPATTGTDRTATQTGQPGTDDRRGPEIFSYLLSLPEHHREDQPQPLSAPANVPGELR